MTTPASDVVDLFMMRIQDYNLDQMYSSSGSLVLVNYTEPWLLDAIDYFSPVSQEDLTYTPSFDNGGAEGFFAGNLSVEVRNILSQIMTLSWWRRAVQNRLQVDNVVSDRDFKTFSAAQNLTAKQNYLSEKIEEIDKLISDYAYRNNDWANWQLGNYAGS